MFFATSRCASSVFCANVDVLIDELGRVNGTQRVAPCRLDEGLLTIARPRLDRLDSRPLDSPEILAVLVLN
jgi:hypothetical protein